MLRIRFQILRLNLGVLVAALAGCTHIQLQNNTLNQMQTVAALQQQQVLDNLAMFSGDYYSVPYFSWIGQGTGAIQDTGTLGPATTTWSHFIAAGIRGWASTVFGVQAARQATQNWTLNPVSDPRRLTLMRCAYQRAASFYHPEEYELLSAVAQHPNCPDCDKWANEFFGSGAPMPAPAAQPQHVPTMSIKVDGTIKVEGTATIKPTTQLNDDSPAVHSISYASETPPTEPAPEIECLPLQEYPLGESQQKPARVAPPPTASPTGVLNNGFTNKCILDYTNPPWPEDPEKWWYCVGKKRDVPKDCWPNYVGHCGDTYIWVPAYGRDQFAKLALVIMDYAVNPPFTPPGAAGTRGPALNEMNVPFALPQLNQLLRLQPQ